ncbi:MAG TPA: autoinducer binding domain-containing protein [Noviherbaspirillum sp.]|nr:autoinducer binding domain-containing protein [Noviherbaspirillum sp.]
MTSWRDDCFNALLHIESERDLFEHVAKIARSIGFEYCAYGIRVPVPVSRPRVAMYNNYSDEWQNRYSECGYLKIDPTVQHALRSTLPVVWSNHLFESTREMWEEARGQGLRFGWAQASRDANGAVGLLTLARGADQLTATELAANEARMTWLTQYTHAAMAHLLIPKLAPEAKVMLTAREKEVLCWTAEGKTAYEISQILSIAERTVNFHINNVVAKLGTSNKTQAAVKAAALGMLA